MSAQKGETKARLENLVRKLREKGYKLTPQRYEILRFLTSTKSHPTVEEVFREVRKKHPMVGLATVYKTLEMLRDLKEIQEVGSGEGGMRYDGANPDPHAHFVCLKCRKVSDVEGLPIADLFQMVEEMTRKQVYNHRIEFYGFCSACSPSQFHRAEYKH